MNNKPNLEHLGVTAPISLAKATEEEKLETEKLIQSLKDQNLFESEEEGQLREKVLGELDLLVKKFVKQVYINRGISVAIAEQAGGKIFAFGSYRLGVHSSGADIDTLCLCPKLVSRSDFFNELGPLLKARTEVEEFTSVEEAYVPVINLKFSGIPIDLVFASIDVNQVLDNLELKDNQMLKGLDEPTVRSLNGSRVTDAILDLVPNIPEFRITLRCIKLWAKRRGIYANVYGYFGGVAWAMLVARVCQLYPNATGASLVNKFFIIASQWKWPHPILLREIESCNIPLRVWNPTVYPSDRAHRMPIITPAFPSMCSTHNVSHSTQVLITQELVRGADLTKKILNNQLNWKELFQKECFFLTYQYYLKVTAYSKNEEIQLKWSGTVESKIRQLVMGLEFNSELVLVHPFPNEFSMKLKTKDINHLIKDKFIQIENEEIKNESGDDIFISSFYLGLLMKAKDEGDNSKRKLDFSKPINDFKLRILALNPDPENSGLSIGTVKRDQLPDNLFTKDELQLRSFQKLSKKQAKKLSKKVKRTLPLSKDDDNDNNNDDDIDNNNKLDEKIKKVKIEPLEIEGDKVEPITELDVNQNEVTENNLNLPCQEEEQQQLTLKDETQKDEENENEDQMILVKQNLSNNNTNLDDLATKPDIKLKLVSDQF